MSSKFIRITIILGIIGMVVQWLLGSFAGVSSILFQVGFIAVILASLTTIIYRGKSWKVRVVRNFLILLSLHGVFGLVLILFSFYSNSFPGSVGKIILKGHSGSIVFLQMSHVGTEEFYNMIESDIHGYVNSGYTIYAEGVRPGSMKSQNTFDRMIGVKMGSGLYESFAQMIGLRAQDGSIYQNVPKSQLRNVDISIDDIVSLIGTGGLTLDPIDLESELRSLTDNHPTAFLGYVIRGVLNSLLRTNGMVTNMDFGMDPQVMDVVLHKRNEHIVDTLISQQEGTGIVLVYGALHFQGVYSLLRANDPSWHIDSIEPRYPYR